MSNNTTESVGDHGDETNLLIHRTNSGHSVEEHNGVELTDLNVSYVSETNKKEARPIIIFRKKPQKPAGPATLYEKLIATVKCGTIQEIERLLATNRELIRDAFIDNKPSTSKFNSKFEIHNHGIENTIDADDDHDLMTACHWAALRSDDALDILIKHGAKQITPNKLGLTPLHLAACRGHAKNIAALLDISADLQKQIEAESLNEQNRIKIRREECLVDAKSAAPQREKRVKYWPGDEYRFYTFLDSDTAFIPGGTALHVASFYAHPDCVRLLLAAGADPCALDVFGRTPLDMAGEAFVYDSVDSNSFGEIVALLLNLNCYKSFKKTVEYGCPLHTAITLNNMQALRLLVYAGMPVNWEIEFLGLPLYVSVRKKSAESFKILLKGVCDPITLNPIDIIEKRTEQTILHYAITYKWEEGVTIALAAGASVNVKDRYGDTPIHVACSVANIKILDEVLNALKDHKIIDSVDDMQGTPLQCAVASGSLECVQRILKEKPNVNLGKLEGYNVFELAAKFGYIDIFRAIYMYDFNYEEIENKRSRDSRIMQIAIKNGSTDILNLLLDRGNIFLAQNVADIMNAAPKPKEMMEKILDHHITHNLTKEDPHCLVVLDYKVLLSGSKEVEQMETIKGLIRTGNRHGQKSLLLHPLIESFLHVKWDALLFIFCIILAIYALFIVSLTCFIISKFKYKDDDDIPVMLNPIGWTVVLYVTSILILISESLLLQGTVDIKKHFLIIETWVKIIFLTLGLILPLILFLSDLNQVEWPRHIASIALLLAWLEIMFLLSKFSKLGLIVQMFGTVAWTIIKILFTFLFLIIGFSLTFMLQFNFTSPFDGFWSAFVKILVMMASEFDYGDLIETNSTEGNKTADNATQNIEEEASDFAPSIIAIQMLFVVFWFLIAIVLMNLMLSVSVSDIQSLEKLGNSMRLEKQVEVLASLENIIFQKNWIANLILPRYLIRFSRVNTTMRLMPNDMSYVNNKKLPTELREAVFAKAKSNKNLYGNKKNNDSSENATDDKLEKLGQQIDGLRTQNEQIINKKFNDLFSRLDGDHNIIGNNCKTFEEIVNQIINNDQATNAVSVKKFKNCVKRIIERKKELNIIDKKINSISNHIDVVQQEQTEVVTKKIDNIMKQINVQKLEQSEKVTKTFEHIVERIDQNEQVINKKMELVVSQMNKLEGKFNDLCSTLDKILLSSKSDD